MSRALSGVLGKCRLRHLPCAGCVIGVGTMAGAFPGREPPSPARPPGTGLRRVLRGYPARAGRCATACKPGAGFCAARRCRKDAGPSRSRPRQTGRGDLTGICRIHRLQPCPQAFTPPDYLLHLGVAKGTGHETPCCRHYRQHEPVE
jgi:hypothetical protein